MDKYTCLAISFSTSLVTFGTEISSLNLSPVESQNHYRIQYGLVKKEIQDDKKIEKKEPLEYGILCESIKKTENPHQFKIFYHYYSTSILEEKNFVSCLFSINKTISVDDRFKLLDEDESDLTLPFYLNNFRYGLNLNITSEQAWTSTVFDNTHTYCSNSTHINDYSSVNLLDIEYKLTDIKPSQIDQYTIQWNACAGLVKRVSSCITNYISKYSRRHGEIVVQPNCIDNPLVELTVYIPEVIKGLKSSSLTSDYLQETYLSIKKIDSKAAERREKKQLKRSLRLNSN